MELVLIDPQVDSKTPKELGLTVYYISTFHKHSQMELALLKNWPLVLYQPQEIKPNLVFKAQNWFSQATTVYAKVY